MCREPLQSVHTKPFGRVLRKHRLAAGFSQEQLGLESGVQRNFISLIETGQNKPTITTIFKLASALNLKPSKLLAETEKLTG
ncbi:MAG: helix-turn-helix transcriptional regulator [Burkholderiales bacterium]|nr:helix-turn-helix transcriptional regulator [Burkholderiales bacterium]